MQQICRVGTSGRCTEDILKSKESAESTLMLCKSSPSVESHCSVAHNSCANTLSSKNRCLGRWCIWSGPRSMRQLFCSKDSPLLGWALKTCFLYWSGAFCGWWGSTSHQMPHAHLQTCPRQQRGRGDKDSSGRSKERSGIKVIHQFPIGLDAGKERMGCFKQSARNESFGTWKCWKAVEGLHLLMEQKAASPLPGVSVTNFQGYFKLPFPIKLK